MPARGTPYTDAELQRAIALHAEDRTWAEVAEILGRPQGSLEVSVCMWRKGAWDAGRRRAEASRQIDETLERAIRVEGIVTIPALADRVGMSDVTVQNRLRALGLDAAMRRRVAFLGMPSQAARNCPAPVKAGARA